MSSSVRETLEGFLAGRVVAAQVVIAVTRAYYGDRVRGAGPEAESLRPLVEVIERAAPGIVELASATAGPGFEIRPAERAFPRTAEAELRRAAEAWLRGDAVPAPTSSAPVPPRSAPDPTRASVVARFRAAVRRLFTAFA